MRLLAVAELRLREGFAARLAWLVAIAFFVGIAAAHWARGADDAARAAHADRVALWVAWGLALVVAAVVPAIGLPSDVRTGAAQTLLAAPVSRFELVLGGVLGYAAFSTLLLVAMAGASILGMQVVGVGAAQRDPVRTVVLPRLVDAGPDGTFVVESGRETATLRFVVPKSIAADDLLRVRVAPRASRIETGPDRASVAALSLHRPDAGESDATTFRFKAGAPFTAHLPLGALRPGDEAELTIRRVVGRWKLAFDERSVEIGGERRLFAGSVVVAALCAVPLLLLLAAVGSLGSARFAAPTAIVVAGTAFVLFVGRTTIVDGASYVVRAAATRKAQGDESAPPEFSSALVAAAKGALAAFSVVPRLDAFDRTDDLVERRAPSIADVARSAAEGLPATAGVVIAAWLLFRRREIQPG